MLEKNACKPRCSVDQKWSEADGCVKKCEPYEIYVTGGSPECVKACPAGYKLQTSRRGRSRILNFPQNSTDRILTTGECMPEVGAIGTGYSKDYSNDANIQICPSTQIINPLFLQTNKMCEETLWNELKTNLAEFKLNNPSICVDLCNQQSISKTPESRLWLGAAPTAPAESNVYPAGSHKITGPRKEILSTNPKDWACKVDFVGPWPTCCKICKDHERVNTHFNIFDRNSPVCIPTCTKGLYKVAGKDASRPVAQNTDPIHMQEICTTTKDQCRQAHQRKDAKSKCKTLPKGADEKMHIINPGYDGITQGYKDQIVGFQMGSTNLITRETNGVQENVTFVKTTICASSSDYIRPDFDRTVGGDIC
jgi:hypothetical protein